MKIKQKVKINKKFSFQSVSEDTVKNIVKSLPSDKASAREIPVDILKNSDFCFSENKNTLLIRISSLIL